MESLSAFESLVGLPSCFHDYTGELTSLLGARRNLHFHPFCRLVKGSAPRAEARCMDCDMTRVQARLAVTQEPFLKLCHGGVGEIVFPLFNSRYLAGVLFLGPFRWQEIGKEMPTNTLEQSPGTFPPGEVVRERERLPALNKEKFDMVTAMARLLTSALAAHLGEGQNPRPGHRPREAILSYLQGHFHLHPRLKDLAVQLGLSESRTGQLVRRHFCVTFPALLNRQRMDYARRLLSNTDFSIGEISARVGMRDPAYFHRLFRREAGMTPLEFRGAHPRGREA